MPVKHAPWCTPAPPVCSAQWDQEAWDTFAEGYRPAGYLGPIHDHWAYQLWSAKVHYTEALAHRAGMLAQPLSTMTDINRHVRVGRMCKCGQCFCCAMLQVFIEAQ